MSLMLGEEEVLPSSQSKILRLQSRFARLSGALPEVMGSPPTITKQSDRAISTINPKVFVAVGDARLGVLRNGLLKVRGTDAINDGVQRNAYDFTNPTAIGLGYSAVTPVVLSFETDAPVFDLLLQRCPKFAVLVDGKLVAAAADTGQAGSAPALSTVNFGSAESRMRDICLIIGGPDPRAFGLFIDPKYTLSPGRFASKERTPFATFLTDSYGNRLGYLGQLSGEIALRMGMPSYYISGMGSTGYVAANSGAPITANSFKDRSTVGSAAYDNVSGLDPDIDILLGGLNDLQTITPAQVLEVLNLRRALFPKAVIAVSGNWRPGNLAKIPIIQTAIDTACQSLKGPWVQVDNVNGVWRNSKGRTGSLGGIGFQVGTGKVGATAGNGNNDLYIETDGTHPQQPEGVSYLAGRAAQGLIAAIMAL